MRVRRALPDRASLPRVCFLHELFEGVDRRLDGDRPRLVCHYFLRLQTVAGDEGHHQIIRADGARPWGEVRDIIAICRANSIWKLALRTSVPKEKGSR